MKENSYYKEKLEEERAELEKELNKIAVHDLKNPKDWTIKAPEIDIMRADENEAADRNEELRISAILLDELTARHNNIMRALKRIGEGKYGICEVDNEPIEEDRLEANPAANTCKEHMGQENELK